MPATTAQAIVEAHTRQMYHQQRRSAISDLPARKGTEVLIGEADGSMAAVVETNEAADRRKTRTVRWQEARLCLLTAARCR